MGSLLGRPIIWLLIFLVRAYQFGVSPLLVGGCRFVPSCSEYAVAALQRHGVWRGSWLAARRVWRCRPGRPGGFDPVP